MNTSNSDELKNEIAQRAVNENAAKVAYQIILGFDKSYRRFHTITAQAQTRFLQGQWTQSQAAVKQRIDIYESFVAETVSSIYQLIQPHSVEHNFWLIAKQSFVSYLSGHDQFELAETFYNSVIGRIFKHRKIDDEHMFVNPSQCHLPPSTSATIVNEIDVSTGVANLFEDILTLYPFQHLYANKSKALSDLKTALITRLTPEQIDSIDKVQILKPAFYRGKAAYLIGRLCMPELTLPFVIALQMNDDNKLEVDALLTERAHVSFVFSFARTYFMVDTQQPSKLISFLHKLLPHKKDFELYMCLGFYKHGKTIFYRNFLAHLSSSKDNFEIAPGIKGLVMAVFHLPSYGVVFKVIKDEFADSKSVSREQVKECYRVVKTSDRVGRMADTHEYMNFSLPLSRINEKMLDYLQTTCAGSLEIKNDTLIIKHLYIERKMTPLNLFFEQETNPDKIRSAIDDLGLCIKQIASANIFPGDMLHKNFGITKTGRVIFYDYDEICFMSERDFRHLPKSDDPYAIDTLSVGPRDVFPEQFEHFIVGKRVLKDMLKSLHSDLFDPTYWQHMQKLAASGQLQNFTPYPASARFIKNEHV